MSTTTKVAPVVVAGFAGILVGWLLAPNISAVRDDFAARFNEQTPILQQLQTSVADIQGRIGQMPDAQTINASIQEQLTAMEQQITAQTDQLTQSLGGTPEAVADGVEELRTRIDEMAGEITGLREDMAASREEAAAQQAPAPDQAGELANEIGATGAILLPGQGAMFGGSRIDLTELDAETNSATMTAEGAEPAEVAAGETVELSQTCTIRLVGIASGAAYLAPEECSEGAPRAAAGEQPQAEAAQQPEAPQPPQAPEAPQPAPGATPPAPEQAAGQPGGENQPPAGEAPAPEQQPGTQVPAEGANAVSDQQPGMQEQNAPNAGQPQGGQPQPQ